MAPRALQVWRLVKEADFEGIRVDAERSFQVLVAADEREDAERTVLALAGEPHPWLLAHDAGEARREAASGMLDLAVLVARGAEVGRALHVVRELLVAAKVPVVTLLLGSGRAAGAPRAGEAARVAAEDAEEAMPDLADAVLEAAPALRLALARQLTPLRDPLIAALVGETARANALYSLTTAVAESVPVLSAPLNLADMVMLTKNQLVMSYRIALACGKRGRPRDVLGEVVGVIGGGFLFRQAGRQLVGLVPFAGIPLKSAVAWAGTVAIGRAVAAWARRGDRVTGRAVGRLYREALKEGKGVVRGLIRGRKEKDRGRG